MGIRILQSGLLTTLQDLGRTGFRQLGINLTGVMDSTAAILTNYLVGNAASEGVLEFHFPMGEFLVEQDVLLAFGGSDFQLKADTTRLENWRPYLIAAGTRIVSSGKPKGCRLYLAVCGGFAATPWLDSISTHLKAEAGGFQGRALQKGDVVPIKNSIAGKSKTPPTGIVKLPWKIAPSVVKDLYSCEACQIIAGPEWDLLTPQARETFLTQAFKITSQSDRMGYRLNGQPLERINGVELVSSAVTKGTIQLLPDGQLIVLMADHQTTGGYPRIGTVTHGSFSALAQQTSGSMIQFSLSSISEAEDQWIRQHRLQSGIRYAAQQQLQNYFL